MLHKSTPLVSTATPGCMAPLGPLSGDSGSCLSYMFSRLSALEDSLRFLLQDAEYEFANVNAVPRCRDQQPSFGSSTIDHVRLGVTFPIVE